jgi:hypothetical protein
VFVLGPVRRHHAAGSVLDGMPVGGLGVGHAERDLVHAVSVKGVMRCDLVAALEGAGEDEADASLLQYVRDAVAPACLEARVRRLGEAECVHEVEGRLGGVPHVHLDVVDAVHRHAVVLFHRRRGRAGSRRRGARNQLFCRHCLMIPVSAVAFNADLLRSWHTSARIWTRLTGGSLRYCARTPADPSRTSART